MAHSWCRLEKNEEDHGTPTDHVEAVDRDQNAERRLEEFPVGFETDVDGLDPGVLLGEAVTVRVRACLVRTNGYNLCTAGGDRDWDRAVSS
jgi:hypothetical protein